MEREPSATGILEVRLLVNFMGSILHVRDKEYREGGSSERNIPCGKISWTDQK